MDSKGKVSFGFKKAVPGIGGQSGASFGFESSSQKASTSFNNRPSMLEDDEDDEGHNFAIGRATMKGSSGNNKTSSLKARVSGVAGAAPLSRSAKERTQDALNVDSSIFDYDGVYDSMKVGEREANARREEEKRKRDPKYIDSFLASSEQRKLDRTRAEAKKIQREREAEGEEFQGTEAFVTDAYKKQMEEMKEAEEKEKCKEEKIRGQSKGVAGFYKNFMEEKDRAHQAAVAASLDKTKSEVMPSASGDANETSVPEAAKGEDAEKRQKIEEAQRKGHNVRLNDDNEVVDERSLLSAGLNTFGRKKKEDELAAEARLASSGGQRESQSDKEAKHRDGAREAREAREAQRRRQSKMIEEQMLELERSKKEEAEKEEEQRKKALVQGRRNDHSSVASARERALERKRKREEEDMKKRQEAE